MAVGSRSAWEPLLRRSMCPGNAMRIVAENSARVTTVLSQLSAAKHGFSTDGFGVAFLCSPTAVTHPTHLTPPTLTTLLALPLCTRPLSHSHQPTPAVPDQYPFATLHHPFSCAASLEFQLQPTTAPPSTPYQANPATRLCSPLATLHDSCSFVIPDSPPSVCVYTSLLPT